MHSLSHKWSELSRGFDSIIRFHNELHQEWDAQLEELNDQVEAEFQKRTDQWKMDDRTWQQKESDIDRAFQALHENWQKKTEPERKRYEKLVGDWQKKQSNQKKLLWVFGALAALSILAVFTGILFCEGIVAGIIFVVLWLYFQTEADKTKKNKHQLNYSEPEPTRPDPGPRPEDPKRPGLPNPCIDLVEEWWSYLEAEPATIRKHGDEGEQILLRTLDNQLSDEFIALSKLMIATNIDLDVLVLGPNGVWILESKFWSGKVILRNGEWQRIKTYMEAGGVENTKEDRNIKSFDKEWLYEKENVQNRLSFAAREYPVAEIIKGGLVFTHPDVELDIDSSCQADYGKTDEWITKILTTPAFADLTMKKALSLVDQLLFFAAAIEGVKPSSAIVVAETLNAKNKHLLDLYKINVASFLSGGESK